MAEVGAIVPAIDKGLLSQYAKVIDVVSTTQCNITLTGFGDNYFSGYSAFVVRKADGTTTIPFNYKQLISAYVSNSGLITHSSFGANLAIGDEILLLNPAIARLIPDVPTDAGQLNCLDFWSLPKEEVQLPAVAADVAMPDVVVAGLPSGATVHRAVAIFTFRAIENTNAAANKLSGSQSIRVRLAAGTWTNAITFADDIFGLDASTREGGDAYIGSINLSAIITGNGTYNFQWAQAIADLANINFNDVQVGLRVWYSV
ncbi:MAG: hypothetical protein PHU23_01115 [Dehalococcoidales bacterium]|nr:hypothetical protein [Dehalococcoidales bacterium]